MKILLPVDASPYAADAVEAVKQRPWPAGTIVRVLSAVEDIGLVEAEGSLMNSSSKELKKRTSLQNESLILWRPAD